MKKFWKKQSVLALFAFLILIGGFFVLSAQRRFGSKEFVRENNALTAGNSLLADEAQKDGDRDGLKDWEEGLWKTNPKNPDTDGDGTFDGEEVRNKRNPLKAGPDDEYKNIQESPLGEVVAQSEPEKNLTLTDIVARDFLFGYFALKQGGQYNAASRDRLIGSLTAGIESSPAKEYTLADLTITQKSDKETLRQYGNELGAALRNFYRNLPEGELRILNAAIKNEDADELFKIERFSESYKNIAIEIAQIRVPLVLQSTHLEFINGYNGIGEALDGLKKIFDDPFGGAVYIKTHKENSKLIDAAFRDLKNYFSRVGIRFKTEEAGYVFQI